MGGWEQRQVEHRRQELHRAGGGEVFVVVHAPGPNCAVVRVEDGPGPWVGKVRILVGQRGEVTPQGVADLVDGVVAVTVLDSMSRS